MKLPRLLLVLSLLPIKWVHADDLPDLSTERPGFSIPSAPVGAGVLQIEQGYTYEWARLGSSKLRTFAAPQSEIRYGISKWLELRLGTVGYEWQSNRMAGRRSVLSGGNDYVLGVKMRLVQQSERGFLPEISLVSSLSLPARGAFTSGGYDPYYTIAADKDLPRKFSPGGECRLFVRYRRAGTSV